MTAEEVFRCLRCGNHKTREEFQKPQAGNMAPRQPCKVCRHEQNRHRYQTTGGRDRVYEVLLQREYGITLAQYEEMERKQGKRCAVCRKPETKKRRTGVVHRLSVDHDHATNTVRALLCSRCNVVVWAIEENHTTLGAIHAYIEAHRDLFSGISS